jgi:hypothetical protein
MLTPQPQGLLFAAALVRRAAAVAGVGLVLLGNGVAAPQSAALAPAQRAACPLQPAAAIAAGRKDGQFALQGDLSSMAAGNIARFIVLGKEAAAAGRPRDAEVAFLMSCQVADRLLGGDSVESANAKYQLGWLYARLAQEGSAGAERAELRTRAERLYADSLRTYQAKYGPAHEKTRFAAEGLPALQQPALPPAARSSSAPSGTTAPLPQPREVAGQSARAAPPLPQSPSASAAPGPSFDCAKARSVPEKLICSDAELARLDRELGRVYARAKNAAADDAAFRRQNSEEWRRREATCRDRDCLLGWYANRHDQLINSMQEQEPAAPAAPAASAVTR